MLPTTLAHADLDWVFDRSGFLLNRARPEDHEVVDGPTNHTQVWIEHADGTGTLVDKGIANTVVALWHAGIDTAFSCEGDDVAWRYVVVRQTHRLVAADLLSELGEDLVEQSGNTTGWFFQLSRI